jgi:hypothetical protein
MTSRIVKIGRNGLTQLITTSFTTDPDGKEGVREHITLETPTPVTETQRMRLLSTWEMGKEWPT